MSHTSTRSTRVHRRDEGSTIILALVMMVIGSLIVGSISSYAISVLRANRILSEETKEAEAVKAGLRMALANPRELYEFCGPDRGGPSNPVVLAPITINGETVTTRCHTISVAAAQGDDERRFGLVATRLGETIPEELVPAPAPASEPSSPPTRYDLSTSVDPREWTGATDEESVTGTIWRPRLPSHGLSPRSPSGTRMPAGWTDCRVFFPGTYVDPILLDGPTFFTAGVYYFENEVRVVGGADVVVGDGSDAGCVTSQDALYYAEKIPGEHNVNGFGATMVFGDRGRLVITNDPAELDRANQPVGAKPISFVINRRYNQDNDYPFLPSSDVSIITVDGDVERDAADDVVVDGNGHPIGLPLDASGRIYVPLSIVGADDPATDGVDEGKLATNAGYRPSVYTPKPRRSDPPVSVTVDKRGSGNVLVSWEPPVFDGGTAITGYRATAQPGGQTCETNGSRSCLVTGLSSSTDVTFTVVAFNKSDAADPTLEVESKPSDPSAVIRPSNGTNPTAGTIAAPTVTYRYDEARLTTDPLNSVVATVRWAPPTGSNVPVTGYTVTLTPTNPAGPALTCALDPTDSWVPEGQTLPYPQPSDLTCDIPIPLVTDAASSNAFARYTATVAATTGGPTATSSGATVNQVAKNRIDMPQACLANLVGILTPPNGTVEANELVAWLRNQPIPNRASCASPAFSPANYPVHTAAVLPSRDGQPPTPVIEIDLEPGITRAANPVEVKIPSYVSMAQGRLKVVNTEGHDVNIVGGVLAAMFDVVDARAAGPGTVKIGYEATAIQRKMQIVSTAGGTVSTAVVQINQNGAWAVNSWRVQ